MKASSIVMKVKQTDFASEDEDLRLAEILEAYLADLERGLAADRQTFLARHPDAAERLASCLDSLEVAQRIGAQLRDDATDGGSQAAVDVSTISTRLGDFRILREIGRGGMGIVYQAEQHSMGRDVALKILPLAALMDRKGLTRFKNEVRSAAALEHPNIIQIYSVGEERGIHYFAMQLIRGQSVARVIEQLRHAEPQRGAHSIAAAVRDSTERPGQPPTGEDPNALSDGEGHAKPSDASTVVARAGETERDRRPRFDAFCRSVARLGVQAAEALHHVHEHGIVHRDVKPANLLVDGEARLWVTDFGLARIEEDAALTLSRDCVGTLRYMAPEQALGHRAKVGHRVDVYSLGATLYELLALQPARRGNEREEMLRQCVAPQTVPLQKIDPAVPVELETIVNKAMELEPTDRYATAQEMADDLRRFLENRPIQARPPTLTDRGFKWLRRHPGLAVVTLVAALLLLLTAGVSTAVVWQAKQKADSARAKAEHEFNVANQNRDMTRAVIHFLVNDVLGAARADTGEAQKLTMLDVLENTEKKLQKAFVDQPLLEAKIRFTLGGVYGEMRLYDAEIRQFRRAYELNKQHLGREHLDTLNCECSMGTALEKKGKFAEAIAIFKTVLAIERRVLPPDHANIGVCMNELGIALSESGSFQAARKLDEETLQWCREHRGAEHRDTLRAMNHLGVSLRETGDREAARDLVQRTLQTAQRVLGPEDPLTLTMMNNLANAHLSLGELAAARQMRAQAFEINERVHGPEAPETLFAMNNLALAMEKMGETAAAHDLYERVVEAKQRVLPPDDPSTIGSMGNLANTQAEMGDVAAAHALREQVFEKLRRILGPEHPHTLTAMKNLANSYFVMRKLEEARALYEQLVERCRRVLGPEHRDTLGAMANLGCVLSAMGESVAARELREQVLATCRRVLSPKDILTLEATYNLANSQAETGAYDVARDTCEQALDGCQRFLGPEHPVTLKVMQNLGVILAGMGESAKARDLYKQVLKTQQRVLVPESPSTLNTMHNLARNLAGTGDWPAACKLLEQVVEGRQRVFVPEHPHTVDARSDLAVALKQAGKPAAAREPRERDAELRRRVQEPEPPDTAEAVRDSDEGNDDKEPNQDSGRTCPTAAGV